jgi:hypothetical protein
MHTSGDMMFLSRLAFLVTPKESLRLQLKGKKYDLIDYFEDYVLVTENLDYEEYFEGPKERIYKAAKEIYMSEVVRNLDLSDSDMFDIFGVFQTELELFDNWWGIKILDCTGIPTEALNA